MEGELKYSNCHLCNYYTVFEYKNLWNCSTCDELTCKFCMIKATMDLERNELYNNLTLKSIPMCKKCVRKILNIDVEKYEDDGDQSHQTVKICHHDLINQMRK